MSRSGGDSHALPCPKCGQPTGVINSRLSDAGTRRRRRCRDCSHKFSTIEVPADPYFVESLRAASLALRKALEALDVIGLGEGAP